MKRPSSFLAALFLAGSICYGQLPEKPREGFYPDAKNGIMYYLSRIGGTDYYSCGHSLFITPEKAKVSCIQNRDSIMAWGLEEPELRDFDTKGDMIIDEKEFACIRKRYGKN
ncbi:MAG: hypothetical protein J7K54_03575 [Candidatus Aenigmarchaeota archaeon]|nr:hypothetical protein [Candidatus Aenigmarchaeota archaeon]